MKAEDYKAIVVSILKSQHPTGMLSLPQTVIAPGFKAKSSDGCVWNVFKTNYDDGYDEVSSCSFRIL
jgi:hypothetical protein